MGRFQACFNQPFLLLIYTVALSHPAAVSRLKLKMSFSGAQCYLDPLGYSSSERTFYKAFGPPAIR